MSGLLTVLMGAVDFYDTEQYAGTSYVPFLGFVVFFVGMMVVFIGAVKLNNAKKQWNLFYDTRDRKDFTKPEYVRERKVGKVLIVVGIIMMLLSFILLPL